MRPGEQSGVVLEDTVESALALNTLTTAMLDIGNGASSGEARRSFRDLSQKLIMPDNRAGMELNDVEAGVLRDASNAAQLNYHFALGYLTCFGKMNNIPKDLLYASAEASNDIMIEKCLIITKTGAAAVRLSMLFQMLYVDTDVRGDNP